MVDQPVPIAIVQNRVMARPAILVIASQEQSAAALEHGLAAPVTVRPCDSPGSPHHDLVVALYPSTTMVERDKEVEVLALMEKEGSLNGVNPWTRR